MTATASLGQVLPRAKDMAEQEEKGPLEKPIDWLSGWKASFERTRQHFGLPVALLLALSVAGGFVWWNWDDIAKRPGVELIIARFEPIIDWFKPIPVAQAGRLTIAVTHLARDNKGREHEGILLDELRHFEVEGVEVLPIDRTVDPEAPAKKAQDLLKKTGADVLIWGSVISLSGKSASAMRLNWTRAREVPGGKASGKYQLPTETIALPPEFWSDLKQILGLLQSSGTRARVFSFKTLR